MNWLKTAALIAPLVLVGCDTAKGLRLDMLAGEYRTTCTGEYSARCLNLRVKHNIGGVNLAVESLKGLRNGQLRYLSNEEFAAGIAGLELAVEREEDDRPNLVSRWFFGDRRPWSPPKLPMELITHDNIEQIFLMAAERNRVALGGKAGSIYPGERRAAEVKTGDSSGATEPSAVEAVSEVPLDDAALQPISQALIALKEVKDKALDCRGVDGYCQAQVDADAAEVALDRAFKCEEDRAAGAPCFATAGLFFQHAQGKAEQTYLANDIAVLQASIADPSEADFNFRGNMHLLMEPCKQDLIARKITGDDYHSQVKGVCEPNARKEFVAPWVNRLDKAQARLAVVEENLARVEAQAAP